MNGEPISTQTTAAARRRYRIASVPGDGIGPEVIAAGLEVLGVLSDRSGTFALDVDHYDWGSDRYRKTGAFMPIDALARLKEADAIYFGAVGAPDVPDHITLWGLRLPICSSLVASDLAARRLVRCFVEVQPATVSYNLIFPRGALQNRAAALFRNWLMSEAGRRDEDSRRYR